MITVVLRGGLGNQMFQYAAGLAAATQRQCPLFLDTVVLHDRFPRKHFTLRSYELDAFTLAPRFNTLSKLARAFPIPGLWIGTDLLVMRGRQLIGAGNILCERDFPFYPNKASGTLLGYWQSEKYFISAEREVRAAFRFQQPPANAAAGFVREIENSNTVSLHIRRGDYAASAVVTQLMGETNLDYYRKAEAYMGERVKEPHFFVFSDDIDWCQKHLKLKSKITYVRHAQGAAADLQLMSLCKHHIIANSTFSWWGAWLNPSSDKIVVAPARWYADRGNQPDIIPAGWIKL